MKSKLERLAGRVPMFLFGDVAAALGALRRQVKVEPIDLRAEIDEGALRRQLAQARGPAVFLFGPEVSAAGRAVVADLVDAGAPVIALCPVAAEGLSSLFALRMAVAQALV